jgi:hypothetical protein
MTQLTIPMHEGRRHRIHLKQEQHDQVRTQLGEWVGHGSRLWPDSVMARVIGRALPFAVTPSHVKVARVRLGLLIPRGAPSAQDHATLSAALGEAPAAKPDPMAEAAELLEEWEAEKVALAARYLPRIQHLLGRRPSA